MNERLWRSMEANRFSQRFCPKTAVISEIFHFTFMFFESLIDILKFENKNMKTTRNVVVMKLNCV